MRNKSKQENRTSKVSGLIPAVGSQFLKGDRVGNVYNGQGTVIECVMQPIPTTFGMRGLYLVNFDNYGEQTMNTAEINLIDNN